MPATRLLVLADPKMLPALANGLRDGGKFDVLTLPIADAAGASAAAQRADAMAVFYGTPDRPLPDALQELAPAVRGRGARVVAVLQRELAAQRDDCFRAGASDLLFMPMPKEQFLSRLADAVALVYSVEPGAPASVQVGARGTLQQLAQATVTASGVHAATALPFQAGETVRLSWSRGPESFEAWGLMVCSAPDAQIRFAGLAPDEEARLRDWLRGAAAASRPLAPPRAPAAPMAGPRAPAAAVAAQRAAPAGGPPPGFADRPRVKETPPSARPVAAPARTPGAPPAVRNGGGRPAAVPVAGTARAGTPPSGNAPAAAVASPKLAAAASGPLAGLFEDSAGAAPAPAAEAAAAAPAGPSWPQVVPAAASRAAGVRFVHDKTVPADAAPVIAAAARKIGGVLSLGECNAIEKAGPESHLADALGARIALEVARSEGARLSNSRSPVVVDDAAVKALTQMVDAAAARLQKESDVAIGRGELENLQLLTAVSAALSRDLLSVKEMADRLRGVGAAPRLGAGALDPEVVLPGQYVPRPAVKSEPAPVRAELRDFVNLEEKSSESRKRGVLYVVMLALAAGIVNLLFFAYPRVTEVRAGNPSGVARLEIAGKAARVTVDSKFSGQADAVQQLIAALRERGVETALLVRENGNAAGQIDVKEGKAYGLATPK